MKLFVGIDPGKGGGIAAIRENGSVFRVVPMPDTDRDIYEAVAAVSSIDGNTRACLEFVRSSPQMGVKSAFTFGQGYGGLKMALVVASVPFDEVTPQKWQKALGCLTKGDKNVSKRRAQELFPDIKITHKIADALLLAEYCRRTSTGATGRDLPDSVAKAADQSAGKKSGHRCVGGCGYPVAAAGMLCGECACEDDGGTW